VTHIINAGQVLGVMIKIVAPIVPHLAEEVYETCRTRHASDRSPSSVFMEHWKPSVSCRSPLNIGGVSHTSQSEWMDAKAHTDMASLLSIRSEVLGLVESARQAK
jgi:isoleucyl-tRNA synthetase